ncbi:hypothetical protein RFI_18361 [Reticulomyxa filosa]|uniref:Uncharacterized protein n=1 Tax=Reticulomyxa filosa TaxID=46433 RepID=X6MY08_RETFI|nr:hypothetical protein RFI_18361 [Reticulomyxa filosa]|eukprot:ETO18885.1 hypothetical protein RFI_18361 [Reticulomyxa filosa]
MTDLCGPLVYNVTSLRNGVAPQASGAKSQSQKSCIKFEGIGIDTNKWNKNEEMFSLLRQGTESGEPALKFQRINTGQRLRKISQSGDPPNEQAEEQSCVDEYSRKEKLKTKKSKLVQDQAKVEDLQIVDKLRKWLLDISRKVEGTTESENISKLSLQMCMLFCMCVFYAIKKGPGDNAKVIRFNKICPGHTMVRCIQEKYDMQKGGARLCIDNCASCPFNLFKLDKSNSEWYCTTAADDGLKDYLSCYKIKTTRGQTTEIVRFPNLVLHTWMGDNQSNRLQKQHKIKVLKKEYFKKIRTAAPTKALQPLNLSYPRFWIEIEKANVYLAVEDMSALQRYDFKAGKRPVDSSIGAYVDKSMEVQLAITASFDTKINFVWYIRKDWALKNAITTFGMRLRGNDTYDDWVWSDHIEVSSKYIHTYLPMLLPLYLDITSRNNQYKTSRKWVAPKCPYPISNLQVQVRPIRLRFDTFSFCMRMAYVKNLHVYKLLKIDWWCISKQVLFCVSFSWIIPSPTVDLIFDCVDLNSKNLVKQIKKEVPFFFKIFLTDERNLEQAVFVSFDKKTQ